MTRSQKPSPSQSQIERFREAAREHGCDEDEAAFDEKLKRIARQKPKPPDKAKSEDGNEEAPE